MGRPIGYNGDITSRFWSKVNKDRVWLDTMNTPCWEWTGAKDSYGYGCFMLNGITTRAYRMTYEWSGGHIPEDLVVHHICENPSCVNPDHLEVINRGENGWFGHIK